MKKYINILLFLLFVTATKAQTYLYHAMPDTNAIWRVDWGSSILCSPPWTYSSYQYTIGNDTIINSLGYKQIYKSGLVDICATSGSYFNYYAGAMRQDTINKKVFFACPGYSSDTIIYDFDLNIGDTIHSVYCFNGSPAGYGASIIKVVQIDSMQIGSDYRKIFLLNTGCYIIEGIGSTSGLLEPLQPTTDDSWQLVCFKNYSNIYPNTSTSCNPIITNILENNVSEIGVNIFPNPILNEATISLNDKNSFIKQISILSCTGESILDIKNLRSSSFHINKKNLVSGLYMIRILTSKKEIFQTKFIIQ